MTNYFDKQGNYINCENLSLAEIYHRAFALGVESVPIKGKIPCGQVVPDTLQGWRYEERPQGEWVWSPVADDGTVSGCCNKCSFSHMFIGGHTAQYNFCPNCGAEMKGSKEE